MEASAKNAHIEQLAKEFAKANKIGFAKVKAFIDSLPSINRGNPNAGRKASLETLHLRRQVVEWLESNKGVQFTVKELAERFGINAYMANNLIVWINKRNDSVKVETVGIRPQPAGQKGKAARVMQAA